QGLELASLVHKLGPRSGDSHADAETKRFHHERLMAGISLPTDRAAGATCIGSRARRLRRARSLPKTPLPLLIASNRPKEIELPERWPVGVAEVKLAVGTLPQHEARQTDLTARSNDEIGIRTIVGIQV